MQTQKSKRNKPSTFRRITIWLLALFLIAGGYLAWFIWGPTLSNPHNCKTIGEIAVPMGYERLKVDPSSFGAYLRQLPLKSRGSQVMRNLKNPFRSPWFMLDEEAETIWTSVFWFNADQLRRFKD